MHSSLWLSALIVLPLLGALVAMLVRKTPGASYVVAVRCQRASRSCCRSWSRSLYKSNIAGAQGFDFISRHVVSAPLGLAYDVALDGLSLLMVVLTALVLLLSLLGGRDKRREPAFVSWLLILTGLTMGSFVAHDVLEFFVFFELTLVPCYFIISGWGGRRARARRAEVLLVHLHRLGVLADRDLVHGLRLPAPAPDLGADLRLRRPGRHHDVARDRGLAVRRLRVGLRGQGPDLAAAHVVAADVRRGAHRGIDRTLGAARQARQLRTVALRGGTVAARPGERATLRLDPGGDRHLVRLDPGVRRQGP